MSFFDFLKKKPEIYTLDLPLWQKGKDLKTIHYQHPDDFRKYTIVIYKPELVTSIYQGRIDNWEEMIDADKDNFNNHKVMDIRHFKINGCDASEYVMSGTEGKDRMIIRNVRIQFDDYYIESVLSAPVKKFIEWNKDFDYLLRRIYIKKSK